MPGDLMRGRHSYAILTMMGVTETIATTQDDYARMAIRLGEQTEYRRHIAARIAESRHRIYRDMTCIRGLEQFLEGAVDQYTA
jgi:predicted O-linked N-acetylglucosamine transferase (SPINDLY family)